MSDEKLEGSESIPLNLPKEELFQLMLMAHEQDKTFNQFVEDFLREYLSELEKNPELLKKFKNEP